MTSKKIDWWKVRTGILYGIILDIFIITAVYLSN